SEEYGVMSETQTAALGRPSRIACCASLLGGSSGGGGRLGLGLGVAGQVFLDARLAAFQATQVVQLARAHCTAALDLHRVDGRAVGLEHALDAVAVRDLAHGERGVEAGVLLADDHAFVGLDALAVAFLDLDVDDDGVARAEGRQLALDLFGFEILQQRVERGLVHGVGLLVCPAFGCRAVVSASARGPASWHWYRWWS